MQRGDDAFDRVIEQGGTDTGVGHLALGLVQMRGTEERFVLPDRLALVVEDRAPCADPAARCVGGRHQVALSIAYPVAGADIAGGQEPRGLAWRRIARFGL